MARRAIRSRWSTRTHRATASGDDLFDPFGHGDLGAGLGRGLLGRPSPLDHGQHGGGRPHPPAPVITRGGIEGQHDQVGTVAGGQHRFDRVSGGQLGERDPAGGVGVAGGSTGGSLMERNLDRWTVVFAVLFVLNTFALLRV